MCCENRHFSLTGKQLSGWRGISRRLGSSKLKAIASIAAVRWLVAWLQSCRYKLLLLNLKKDNAKLHLVLFKLKDL